MTRRQAFKITTVATAACVTLRKLESRAAPGGSGNPAAPGGSFKVPPLSYPFDALEPHIDARTMEIHHDKHHAAYVMNLNKAVADAPELANKPIEELLKDLNGLPEKVRMSVRNQGGGHYNHSLFWQMMKRDGGGEPKGELVKAIENVFGSYSSFKDKFTEAATKVFGSGWTWLVKEGATVRVESMPNQDSPLSQGKLPLLRIDLWEHAYYLKYQNRRPEYIAAWFKVIDWDFVSERFSS